MWCIPGNLDNEYIERMEDILDLLEKPADSKEPVVVLDERPTVLHAEVRTPQPARPGRIARRDSEYRRCGTANIFGVAAPKIGDHMTTVTPNRKADQFAQAMKRIAERYPDADRIHIIMDNLNTHRECSITGTFGELEGRRLWKRFQVHYTPKHASWLNPAEIILSLVSRECLGRDRISDIGELRRRVARWNSAANREKRKIHWKFTTADARRKFKYGRRNVRISLARH